MAKSSKSSGATKPDSAVHKFGQIIGYLLEVAIKPFLDRFAQENHLFLDVKGYRQIRGEKQSLAWTDIKGSSHNLDFVLERGGTDAVQGVPVAFIEAAWRRYKRHSKNKAQEIQGAILPLAQKYEYAHPFLGVILAGEFSDNSLKQLRLAGFSVLHFPYESVLEAFAEFGIDVGYESGADKDILEEKIAQFYALPNPEDVARKLVELNQPEVDAFLSALKVVVSRRVEQVHVLPLHGSSNVLTTVTDAIDFIADYEETVSPSIFCRYEIIVRFNNGSVVTGVLQSKIEALEFLATYA